MARADLLVTLVRAAGAGDRELLRRAVEALVTEERAKQHHVLADRLESSFVENGKRPAAPSDDQAHQLLYAVEPQRGMDDLVLPEVVTKTCSDVVSG